MKNAKTLGAVYIYIYIVSFRKIVGQNKNKREENLKMNLKGEKEKISIKREGSKKVE